MRAVAARSHTDFFATWSQVITDDMGANVLARRWDSHSLCGPQFCVTQFQNMTVSRDIGFGQ